MTNQIASPSGGEGDEAYEIGKEDGYSEAVQQIDQLTGGDGEYRYCLGMEYSERHCPDPETMIRRIVERFGRPPDPAVGATADIEAWLDDVLDRHDMIVCQGTGKSTRRTELLAALARAGGSEVRREGDRTAWLLENENGSGPPVWLRLKEPQVGIPGIRAADKFNARMWQDMTADANEALAFSRKEDAEMFLELLKPRGQWLRATEHKFIRALSDQEGDGR